MALEKRYDPHQVEEGKYERWKGRGYFKSGDQSKPPFSLVIPPPNVTGKLHLGHAWNNTIQDVITRYKKAQGYDVLWLPGMDHAGIATQAKVEELLRSEGKDKYQLGREKFLAEMWRWKDKYATSIHEQWASLGLALDYEKERFTLDENLDLAVRAVFKKLYDKGLIYRGERIINVDPELRMLYQISKSSIRTSKAVSTIFATRLSALKNRSSSPRRVPRRCSAMSLFLSIPTISDTPISSARKSQIPPMVDRFRSWSMNMSIRNSAQES